MTYHTHKMHLYFTHYITLSHAHSFPSSTSLQCDFYYQICLTGQYVIPNKNRISSVSELNKIPHIYWVLRRGNFIYSSVNEHLTAVNSTTVNVVGVQVSVIY